ncbi:MAG: hypothetical protein LBV12_11190 [Puniceicoccales bacterium]|jgi:hypothetical protein|nr:hypothetical protein [Puniceicoccales bacterium]
MTLVTAYILLGVIFVVAGLALVSGSQPVSSMLRAFPRSMGAAVVLFGGGAVWFLWIVSQLGESDLAGFPRNWMLGIFGVTALLSFKYLRDLLAVRGLAVVMLLSARALLDIGYMKLPYSFVLACTCYILVVLGIWWGAAPYVFRNWSTWALEKRPRTLAIGTIILVIGIANLAAACFAPSSAT